MVTAWAGLTIAVILSVVAAAQLIFPDVAIVAWESGDLLASLVFFALIGGLCVWLVVYGRTLFLRLLKRVDSPEEPRRD
jgi:hypothetical protein